MKELASETKNVGIVVLQGDVPSEYLEDPFRPDLR